jgi:hypothetical protein
VQVSFVDLGLAYRCNGAAGWNRDTDDVLAALHVLAESLTLDAYQNLPNTHREGADIVFEGLSTDVHLSLTVDDAGNVVVHHIVTRMRP